MALGGNSQPVPTTRDFPQPSIPLTREYPQQAAPPQPRQAPAPKPTVIVQQQGSNNAQKVMGSLANALKGSVQIKAPPGAEFWLYLAFLYGMHIFTVGRVTQFDFFGMVLYLPVKAFVGYIILAIILSRRFYRQAISWDAIQLSFFQCVVLFIGAQLSVMVAGSKFDIPFANSSIALPDLIKMILVLPFASLWTMNLISNADPLQTKLDLVLVKLNSDSVMTILTIGCVVVFLLPLVRVSDVAGTSVNLIPNPLALLKQFGEAAVSSVQALLKAGSEAIFAPIRAATDTGPDVDSQGKPQGVIIDMPYSAEGKGNAVDTPEYGESERVTITTGILNKDLSGSSIELKLGCSAKQGASVTIKEARGTPSPSSVILQEQLQYETMSCTFNTGTRFAKDPAKPQLSTSDSLPIGDDVVVMEFTYDFDTTSELNGLFIPQALFNSRIAQVRKEIALQEAAGPTSQQDVMDRVLATFSGASAPIAISPNKPSVVAMDWPYNKYLVGAKSGGEFQIRVQTRKNDMNLWEGELNKVYEQNLYLPNGFSLVKCEPYGFVGQTAVVSTSGAGGGGSSGADDKNVTFLCNTPPGYKAYKLTRTFTQKTGFPLLTCTIKVDDVSALGLGPEPVSHKFRGCAVYNYLVKKEFPLKVTAEGSPTDDGGAIPGGACAYDCKKSPCPDGETQGGGSCTGVDMVCCQPAGSDCAYECQKSPCSSSYTQVSGKCTGIDVVCCQPKTGSGASQYCSYTCRTDCQSSETPAGGKCADLDDVCCMPASAPPPPSASFTTNGKAIDAYYYYYGCKYNYHGLCCSSWMNGVGDCMVAASQRTKIPIEVFVAIPLMEGACVAGTQASNAKCIAQDGKTVIGDAVNNMYSIETTTGKRTCWGSDSGNWRPFVGYDTKCDSVNGFAELIMSESQYAAARAEIAKANPDPARVVELMVNPGGYAESKTWAGEVASVMGYFREYAMAGGMV